MELKDLNSKIEKTKEWFRREIGSLRTGRASPALVENIKVEYYGAPTPLSHLASVKVEDAKTLVIEPWDKNLLETIARALSDSPLGIQPVASKEAIRLNLSPLTQERRAVLLKILNEKLEEAKISARKIRDEYWSEVQRQERDKKISEDEKFRLKDKLEEEIKKSIEELEQISQTKKHEIES